MRKNSKKKVVWTLTNTYSLPVDIIPKQDGQVRAVVDFPKKYPTAIHPASITVKDVKARIGQSDSSGVGGGRREVTQQQIGLYSKNFAGSLFTINVPYHFQTRQSTYLFLKLKMEKGRVKMSFFDGFLTANEWILDRKGVQMSMNQLVRYQDVLDDNRKKYKPTQQQFLDELDSDQL